MLLSQFIPLYMETYVEERNKPAVQIQKRLMLDRILLTVGDRDLKEFDEVQVVLLQSRLRKRGCGPKTINNYQTCLRNMLKWARKPYKLIEVIPDIEPLKVFQEDVRYLTEAQIVMVSIRLQPLWRQMFLFAVNTGLRIGELRALQWKHVNWKQLNVRVIQSTSGRFSLIGSTKGKGRTVPLCEAAREAIQNLDGGSQFVFARPKVLGKPDAPLTYKACDLGLARATRTVKGLDWVGWHTCRHSFASRLVMAGVPLAEIRNLLGHVDISTTLRYAHLAPSTLSRAVAELDKLR